MTSLDLFVFGGCAGLCVYFLTTHFFAVFYSILEETRVKPSKTAGTMIMQKTQLRLLPVSPSLVGVAH